MPSAFTQDVAAGRRFEFGRNWARFLGSLNAERIALARQSLQTMLDTNTLAGKTFLDVGSGSGLFSLVARQLGARVRSFDYDPEPGGGLLFIAIYNDQGTWSQHWRRIKYLYVQEVADRAARTVHGGCHGDA